MTEQEENLLFAETRLSLSKYFDLPQGENAPTHWDGLRCALRTEVIYKLNYGFEQLCSLLYRIDVPEDRVKAALCWPSQVMAATEITRLIVEREKEKIRFRQQFKQNPKP